MVDGDVDPKNLGSLQGFCGQLAGKKVSFRREKESKPRTPWIIVQT
jgi:hypothetical protein